MLTQSPEKQEKYQEVLQVAETLYRQNPDWVTFFREVLGVEGTVRKSFPTFEDLTAFEQTQEFDKIQKLLVRLREKRSAVDVESEPTRVITVRLPKSMHEYLRTEAHDLRTSMNKLCISKLLQVIGEDMIPNERTTGGASTPAAKPEPSYASVGASGNGTFGLRAHQPSPGGFSGSTGSGHSSQPQPFKPQPRF